jgi:enoyl-CoA hydratase/carnithine racemase
VVFASALERYFTAGGDIAVLRALNAESMLRWTTISQEIAQLLRESPKPLLAAGRGRRPRDRGPVRRPLRRRRRAARAARDPHRLLSAAGGHAHAGATLARTLGRHRALRLLYEGKLLAATEAQAVGLIDIIVEPRVLRTEVQAYATELAARPREALAAIRLVVAAAELPYEDFLERERQEAVRIVTTPDFAEGLAAFAEKRPPRWR